ncbi:hypothetical protein RHMOL_Rhmol01G0354400 [Rhododendron molle]|uniref:Uncharacterized protein n=1 Tax=Rhododendron molle TaxID=49168 RepID=A0ACC0QCJ0_RHOML|nr:hypothetical protein RHMOL_Rhmol01G0354400 [Rhododendron molle]
MLEEEVNRCQIQEWYPKFKSVSIRTLMHELPESFVQYLRDDSGPFLLPLSISNEDALPNRIHNPEEEEDFVVSEGSGDESEKNSPPPSFPELEFQIKESIETLGGAVFPKLNWSSPKDSAWISSTGTLKCTSFIEIALLLRSSVSLVHDLHHAYDSCIDKTSSRPSNFFLALRKWAPSLQPEMEFRCFKNELKMAIQEFFTDEVRLKFDLENYTFDVYVREDGRVKLLDFNPWGAFTLPLLFTWEELGKDSEDGNTLEFRMVESQCGVRPGLKTAVPYDYLDTSEGSGWDQFLRNAENDTVDNVASPNKSSKLPEFAKDGSIDDDQLNPAMKEEIDREVKGYPRRLPKIMRESVSLGNERLVPIFVYDSGSLKRNCTPKDY